MVEYTFRLNKGLVSCLAKLVRAGGPVLRRDLRLTHSQYTNFQKLAYWKMARQVPDERGRTRGRPWEATQFGDFFMRKATQAFREVVTYRRQVVRVQGPIVWVDQVDPDWKKAEWYVETRRAAGPDVPERQVALPI
jgi:hypothetical protein